MSNDIPTVSLGHAQFNQIYQSQGKIFKTIEGFFDKTINGVKKIPFTGKEQVKTAFLTDLKNIQQNVKTGNLDIDNLADKIAKCFIKYNEPICSIIFNTETENSLDIKFS